MPTLGVALAPLPVRLVFCKGSGRLASVSPWLTWTGAGDAFRFGDQFAPDLSGAALKAAMGKAFLVPGRDVMETWADFLAATFLTPGAHCTFAETRKRLGDGRFPIPICTAITELVPLTETQRWSWVEFTPWSIRKCAEADAMPSEEFAADLQTLIAIWGSAHTFDSEHAEEQSDCWSALLAQLKDRLKDSVWEGTWLNGSSIKLRDVGIDVNVPFPALVNNKHRHCCNGRESGRHWQQGTGDRFQAGICLSARRGKGYC